MRLKEIRLIVIATAMFCIFAQPTLATSAMSVEPAHIDVGQGEEFTVNITVYPAENEVYGASYTLHFNNTLLNATSQTQGPFLTQDGQSSTVWGNVIDNPNGTIEYSESRMGIDFGVTDPGVLTTITFQVIGVEGTSPLGISEYNGELLYSTSGSIPTDINDGTCKIEDTTATPTPTTPPTTTVTSTPVQTPTTLLITPTPTATVTQTPTILSTPLSPPTTIASSISPTVPTSPPEEKSEENNGLSGFRSVFVIIGLLAVFILKRKNVRK